MRRPRLSIGKQLQPRLEPSLICLNFTKLRLTASQGWGGREVDDGLVEVIEVIREDVLHDGKQHFRDLIFLVASRTERLISRV